MATDIWKNPLKDIADPFGSMHKLAEDSAEVPFAEQMAATATASDFAEAYHVVLTTLSCAAKFSCGGEADELLSMESDAIAATEKNVSLFDAGIAYCRGRNTAVQDSAKKNAWQKCQTHLSNWKTAFADAPAAVAAAIAVDKRLHDIRTPLSVDEAIAIVQKAGIARTESLTEIVRWYLVDIRQKYRKDLEVKATQVTCGRCQRKHDEGSECPYCRQATGSLEEAEKALREKKWSTAAQKAKDVLSIWSDDARAHRIEEEANKGIEAEKAALAAVRSAETAIRNSLSAGNIDEAEAKATEASILPGFDSAKWQAEIKKAKVEENRRQEIGSAREKFEDALLTGDWKEAEKAGRERARLGDGTTDDWIAAIRKARENRKIVLEKGCSDSLASFDKAFPTRLDEADAALNSATKAFTALKAEFRNSPEVPKTERGILERTRKLNSKRRELLVENLGAVRNLEAMGSETGEPVIILAWNPASGGTQASRWRVFRRGVEPGLPKHQLADVTEPRFRDQQDLKLGEIYEYSVVPLVEVSGKWESGGQKAVAISRPVFCSSPLPEGAFKGMGEGIEGKAGVVTLQWSLPEGLSPKASYKVRLSRGDGKIKDRDVTAENGHFEDVDVSVGAAYDYSLGFQLNGRDMGESRIRVPVAKVSMPPPVGAISFGRLGGALLARWAWPEGLETCLWSVSEKRPMSPDDLPKTARRRVSRKTYDEKGGILPMALPECSACWLSVWGVRTFGTHEFISRVTSVPMGETVLEYELETRARSLFSKRKPARLVLRSSGGVLPEIEIRAAKKRNEVLSRRSGRVVILIPAGEYLPEMSIPLEGPEPSGAAGVGSPDSRIVFKGPVSSGEFVRIYLSHPEAENCKVKHPSDFEVK